MRVVSESLDSVFVGFDLVVLHGHELEGEATIGRKVVVGHQPPDPGEDPQGGGEAEDAVLEVAQDAEGLLELLELVLQGHADESLVGLADLPVEGLVGRPILAADLDERTEEMATVQALGGDAQEVVDGRPHHQAARVGVDLLGVEVVGRRGHHAAHGGIVIVGAGVGGAEAGQAEGQHVVLALEGRHEGAADAL